MDLDIACNKYVPQVFIDEMKKLIDGYKLIKNGISHIKGKFVLRDGTKLIVTNKQDALYYAFMQCVSACPQGIELFMRCSTNYLQLKTIYHQRKNHKLKEDWVDGFCKNFVEKLPYAKELIIGEKQNDKD
jgi:hypothetical protein